MKSALKVPQNAQSLCGQVETLFFSSPAFSAGRLKTADKSSAMFAGKICVREGDPIVLHGQWGTHAKYGRQFQAEWFEYDSAPPAEGLAQYLAGHPALKGIGPVKARRIAEKYAAGFDRALAERPEEIARAAGVPLSTIETLAAEWTKVKAVRSALTILSAYGLTHHQVTTLVEKHGNGIVALFQEEPYRLVGEIRGMGFKRVDKVARQLGTAKADPSRIRAGIISCVQEALDQGDCWVEWRELVEKANDLLIIDRLESRELIEAQLESLTQDGDLAAPSHFGRIQMGLPAVVRMETDLAGIFRQGAQPNPVLVDKDDSDFEAAFIVHAGALNDDQRRAFINAARYSVSLISGGAGSGKTFTLTSIADFYEAQGLTVTLTAPTGKAAKRMEQVTGRPALTIHRLLEYNGREFGRGPDSPLGTDLVIVDEMSMVNVPLCWRLFRAIDLKRTAVVLVGDHNQLPPVGPGDVLRDLIQPSAVPTVILDKVVRQAGVLKENCTAVLAGQVRPSVKDAATPPWLVADRFTEAEAARDFLVSLFEGGTLDRLGYDLMRDVQVLTPTHMGPLGTRELNIALQRIIQQRLHGFITPPVTPGRSPRIYLHDKVMQTRNDYKLGVMNGAVGIVVETDERGNLVVDFDGERVEMDRESGAAGNLQLAYACTIHKSQGSEYPCVICVVHKAHSFQHHRGLLYTGVTRARKTAIVIGDRWGIRNCAQVVKNLDRATYLSFLLDPDCGEAC